MSVHYERYCADCKKFGYKPTMTEAELHIAWGIKEEIIELPSLKIRPKNQRPITPTLENHIKKPIEEREPQLKNEELAKQLDEMISKKKNKPIKKEKIVRVPRGNSLAHLSLDELRAYKSAQRLAQYHKTKVLKPRKVLTDEERKAKRSEYSKSYIQKTKEQGIKRKPLTDEQKESYRKWKIEYRRKLGIKERTKMSEEDRKASIKEQSKRWRDKCKAEGKKRVRTPEQSRQYSNNRRIKKLALQIIEKLNNAKIA